MLAPAVTMGVPRTSTNYTLASESMVSGGKSSSTNYALDGAIDPSSGSPAGSANYSLKPGYVGQQYDLVALDVTATSPSVSEGATNQMLVSAVMDDTSTLVLDPADLAWSVVTGPLSGVSATGLAQSVPTFADMLATVQADLGILSGSADFTVVNVNNDDTGPVAGDGIDDAWQFENFDEDNDDLLDASEAASADPSANPDLDSDSNLVEWLGDLDPNDPASFFRWFVSGKSGDTVTVIANRVVPGTVFSLQSTLDLENGPWVTVDSLAPEAETLDQPFSSANATEARRWYRFFLDPAP